MLPHPSWGRESWFRTLFFFLPQHIAQCLTHHESSINIWSMYECVSKKIFSYAINYTTSDFLYVSLPILVSTFMEKWLLEILLEISPRMTHIWFKSEEQSIWHHHKCFQMLKVTKWAELLLTDYGYHVWQN